MIHCYLKTWYWGKIFNYKVAKNLITINLLIKSFKFGCCKEGVFKSCYHGNQNTTENKSNYCNSIYTGSSILNDLFYSFIMLKWVIPCHFINVCLFFPQRTLLDVLFELKISSVVQLLSKKCLKTCTVSESKLWVKRAGNHHHHGLMFSHDHYCIDETIELHICHIVIVLGMNDHSVFSPFLQIINQFPKNSTFEINGKMRKNFFYWESQQFHIFWHCASKIGVGEPSIAHKKHQSSYLWKRTNRHHWHTPFKSNMPLD